MMGSEEILPKNLVILPAGTRMPLAILEPSPLIKVIFPNVFSAGMGAGAGGSGECLGTVIGEHVETDAAQPIRAGEAEADIADMNEKRTKKRINKKVKINL